MNDLNAAAQLDAMTQFYNATRNSVETIMRYAANPAVLPAVREAAQDTLVQIDTLLSTVLMCGIYLGDAELPDYDGE